MYLVRSLMFVSPAAIVLLALLGQRDLLAWSLFRLFCKATGEDQESTPVEETDEPEGVSPMLRAHLPEILGADKLLEVLGGDGLQFLDQAQYPDHFLSLLPTQRVKELLNRAVASLGPVEADFTHLARVTQR